MTDPLHCECCPSTVTNETLFICASLDLPAVIFCPEHYIEHVEHAHGGHTMPGCLTLEEARASL